VGEPAIFTLVGQLCRVQGYRIRPVKRQARPIAAFVRGPTETG
jgi:hypothetical protein